MMIKMRFLFIVLWILVLQQSFVCSIYQSTSRVDPLLPTSFDLSNLLSEEVSEFTVAKEDWSLPKEYQYHGTTTISFICADGIIVAVDSRASIGNYVGSRTVKKIFPVTDTILATMAGGAADCAFWIRRLSRQVRVVEYDNQTKLPVKAVARLLASTLRQYRGSELSVGTMVAGYDNGNKPSIHYVDSEGTCAEGKLFCVGSGATIAYAILDAENLIEKSKDEAINIAKFAIRHSTDRDSFSGGYINIFLVTKTGFQHLERVDSRSIIV